MKLYVHFTENDAKIAILKWKEGWKIDDIAKYLNFNPSTIWRNLEKAKSFKWKQTQTWAKKVFNWTLYDWKNRKQNIENRKWENHEQKLTIKYQSFVEFAHSYLQKNILKRKKLFSPQAIIDMYIKTFGHKKWAYYPQKSQFYEWIKQQKYGFKKYMFPNNGGRKYKKKLVKSRSPRFDSIENREEAANLRLEEGHLEIDSLEGKKTDKFAIATMIDRKTRKIALQLYKNKCPQSFLQATLLNLKKFPNVKTITLDNGVENSLLGKIANGIKLYNTHPYSSFEKASIENSHRFIRRIKPKGTSLDGLNLQDIELIENYINNYPRKITKAI